MKNGTVVFQLATQRNGIGQLTIVCHRNVAIMKMEQKRLHVVDRVVAAGTVANVTNRGIPDQTLHIAWIGKDFRKQATIPVLIKVLAVSRDDPGPLLSTVLQVVQTEVGDSVGFWHAKNAKNPTLFI